MNVHLVDNKLPQIEIETKKVKIFQSCIIDWYSCNSRTYPWRETKDPFKIIIAEVLLRLTGAWKAKPAYEAIIAKYGTVSNMANANPLDLIPIFQPLGLTSRAFALIEIAKDIMRRFNGIVPNNYEELTSINGIGRYTANAVLCLSFAKAVPLLDESISRILSRCFDISLNKKAYANKELWLIALRLLPTSHYREYNLGLLDFGACICKYSKTECDLCPLTTICTTYNSREPEVE